MARHAVQKPAFNGRRVDGAVLLYANVRERAFGNFAFFVHADFIKDVLREREADTCFVVQERICRIDFVRNFHFWILLGSGNRSCRDFETPVLEQLNSVDDARVESDFFDVAIPGETECFC